MEISMQVDGEQLKVTRGLELPLLSSGSRQQTTAQCIP